MIAAAAPAGTQVVKAFNTTLAGTLIAGSVAGQPLDVFIAGDDDAAKAKVARLVQDGGLRPIYVGPLRRARAGGGRLFAHGHPAHARHPLRVGAEGLALIALGTVLCG